MEIVKSQDSTLIFFEQSLLATPFYFIRAEHIATGDVVSWEPTNTADDTSGQQRVVFAFAEGTDATLQEGDYTFKLYDQSSAGNTDPDNANSLLITRYVKVAPPEEAPDPVASFTIDDSTPGVGLTSTFTDTSTNRPTSWAWTITGGAYSFTGGTSATSQNPKVIFTEAVTYTVTLTATNAGGSDSTSSSYLVYALPVADFSADDVTPTTSDVVTFTDSTTNTPTSWAWTFTPSTVTYVSGTSSTSQNPKVTFDADDTYDVQLVATNPGGDDTELKSSYITVTTPLTNVYSSLFTGVSQKVISTSDSVLNFERTDAFTIEGWVKKAADADSGYFWGRFDPTPYTGWLIYVNASNEVIVLFANSASNKFVVYTQSKFLASSGWTHVAVSNSGVAGWQGITIYFDGVAQTKLLSGSDTLTGSIQGSRPYELGEFFNGNLDEVRVWNRLLTQPEIVESKDLIDPSTHSQYADLLSNQQLGDGSTWDGANHSYPDVEDTNLNATSSGMPEAAVEADVHA